MGLFGFCIFVVLFYRCSEYKDEYLFDCIIEQYTSYFSPSEDKILCIVDVHNWSDSTSLLQIFSIEKNDISSGYYFMATFKNIKIIYSTLSVDSMNSNDSTDFQFFSSKLKWTKIKLENSINVNELRPPEEFDEVQVIYNNDRQCIDTTLLSRDFFEKIKLNCNSCGN